jgi:predicted DNA-binding transcriptional regulator YafY
MTLLRQWAMLQEIPREPLKKSTTQIFSALRELDHSVDKRTVQRDLGRLSEIFHYTSETAGRAEMWFWPKDAKLLDLPAMDAPLAAAFLLSQEHLAPLLPPATLRLIGPYFSRAEQVLRETPGALAAWRSRVCVLSRGPRLQNPKILESVQVEVYDAVLSGSQLKVQYRPRAAKETKQYLLHPLGLVVYDGVVYLIATAGEHKDPVMWSLHRMKSATRLNESANVIKGFDLGEFARKAFRFPVSDQTLNLVARFRVDIAKHLEERPLASDQVCKPVDGEVELSATVPDTDDLRWWLLSFGEGVEVRKPAALRSELKGRLATAAKRYD